MISPDVASTLWHERLVAVRRNFAAGIYWKPSARLIAEFSTGRTPVLSNLHLSMY